MSKSKMVGGENVSSAWLSAIQHILANGGRVANLVVTVGNGTENLKVRRCLDGFLKSAREKDEGVLSVQSVANTIFPTSLYRAAGSAEELFALHATARVVRERLKDKEEYFDRLVAWPTSGGPLNQLESVVTRLRSVSYLSSAYELGISSPIDMQAEEDQCRDIRVYDPQRDHRIMGFPCLSHISLTVLSGELHLTALYRNQHFIRKAYGNYIGLLDLASFLSEQAGLAVGELVVVATHADLEIRSFGKRAVQSLVNECTSPS